MNFSSNLNSKVADAFSWNEITKNKWNEKHEAGKNGRIANSDIQTRFCQYSVACSTNLRLFLVTQKTGWIGKSNMQLYFLRELGNNQFCALKFYSHELRQLRIIQFVNQNQWKSNYTNRRNLELFKSLIKINQNQNVQKSNIILVRIKLKK